MLILAPLWVDVKETRDPERILRGLCIYLYPL